MPYGTPMSCRSKRYHTIDAATQISAARALTLHAARLRDNGRPYGIEAAKAKLFATASEDGSVRLWNIENQKLVRELKGDYPSTFRLAQLQLALAPDVAENNLSAVSLNLLFGEFHGAPLNVKRKM